MTGRLAPRLKTGFGLLVGVVLLVGGVAPYGFGWRTEQTITTLVRAVEQVFDVPLYTTQYVRGWFGATAETWLALPPAVLTALWPYLPPEWLPAAPGDGFTLRHHIQHGPFPLGSRPERKSAFSPVQTVLTSTLVPGAPGRLRDTSPLLHIHTTVFLGGAGQGHIVMPAFTAPRADQSGPRLVWGGLQGDVRVDAHGRYVTGNVRAPDLAWSGKASRVTCSDLVLRTAIITARRQPSRNDAHLHLGTITVTPHQRSHTAWAVTGADLQTHTALTSHILEGTAALNLQTVLLDGMPYGQGTSALTFARLSLPGLFRFWQEVWVLQREEPSLASLWTRLLLSGELAQLLMPLLQTSPELTLSHLSLHTPDGEVRVRLQVHVDAQRLLPPGYMVQLLQTVEAEAVVEVPAALARSLAMAQARRAMYARSRLTALLPDAALNAVAGPLIERSMQHLVEQGYLVLDGAVYKSQARYKHGQLWVQGKPVNLHEVWP